MGAQGVATSLRGDLWVCDESLRWVRGVLAYEVCTII